MGGGQGQRPDAGNRIDSRQRGNASQLLEKYKNLARDAQTQGDRVTAEYYLQFADHYFRVLNEHRARQEEFRERQEGQRERPRYPDQRFDDGEDDGGDDLRDERDEDATAPISISGLPPAIGTAASDDSSDRDRRHEAGDGDDDRASRPRGRGRPPRRQDAASSETGEARQAEDAAGAGVAAAVR